MKIVFAHNVYNRYKTLLDTIKIENQHFNDTYFSIAHNTTFDKNGVDFDVIKNINFNYFSTTEHKIGCVNGLILSIKELLKYDFDVLIFSHDDVRLTDINTVKSNISLLINDKFDIIYRNPIEYGEKYAMLECIYFSKKSAEKIFFDLNLYPSNYDIPVDCRNSNSPEVWLYNKINELNFNTYVYKFNNNMNYNIELNKTMGYIHINAGIRGWID